jgi:hypothetical protein
MRVPFFRVPFVAAAAVAVTLAAVPSAAPAQYVTLSGRGTAVEPFAGLTSGEFTFAFTLRRSPRIERGMGEFIKLEESAGTFRQGTTTANLTGDLYFFSNPNFLEGGSPQGGFEFSAYDQGEYLIRVSSAQVFEFVSEQRATFVLGDYNAIDYSDDGFEPRTSVSSFNVASSVVPEPGTWALLGTGLLALGGVAHRRRRQSV